jgi:hypothetical protein
VVLLLAERFSAGHLRQGHARTHVTETRRVSIWPSGCPQRVDLSRLSVPTHTRGENTRAPSGGSARSASGGQQPAVPLQATQPAPTKPLWLARTHLGASPSPRVSSQLSGPELISPSPGTSPYAAPAAQRMGPAGITGKGHAYLAGREDTSLYARLDRGGLRLRWTLLLFPRSPLSRRRASLSRPPPTSPRPHPVLSAWPAPEDALVGLEPKVPHPPFPSAAPPHHPAS